VIRFVLARLAAAVPVLVALSLIAFALESLAPGDPARLLIEASGMRPAPPEAVAALRAELGLEEPAPLRYARWLGDAVRGDFGRSYRTYKPVAETYLTHFPATLLLASVSIALAGAIALPLGLVAAYRRGRAADTAAQLLSVVGAAVPGFWLALLAILLFAVTLRWLPAFGSLTPAGMALPVLVLTVQNLAVMTRLTRAVTLDVLGQDFVGVARAKGLPGLRIAWGHVLPNVLPPALTQFGLELAHLLAGAAVIEYVFAWPGIGRLAVEAALVRDGPVVVGFTVAAGLLFIGVNLAIDLIVAAVDPRVRAV
jgi:peptide/nickel transport system permease protein